MSIYHGITPDSDSVILVTGFAATETTREQMCDDLARAMGWIRDNGLWCDPLSEWKYAFPPDPFKSAADSRTLVAWLTADAAQNCFRRRRFIEILTGEIRSFYFGDILDAMTAPLPVIAEAAWRAIQPK